MGSIGSAVQHKSSCISSVLSSVLPNVRRTRETETTEAQEMGGCASVASLEILHEKTLAVPRRRNVLQYFLCGLHLHRDLARSVLRWRDLALLDHCHDGRVWRCVHRHVHDGEYAVGDVPRAGLGLVAGQHRLARRETHQQRKYDLQRAEAFKTQLSEDLITALDADNTGDVNELEFVVGMIISRRRSMRREARF